MKNYSLAPLIAICLTTTMFADDAKWSYDGKTGPQNWGKIADEFIMCEIGSHQSPIDITYQTEVKNPEKITFDYKANSKSIINNGHTIQVDYNPGSHIKKGNDTYDLLQFHFHSPAENLIQNKRYPLSMHIVHQDKEGKLLVIGIKFKIGKENKALVPIWKKMPENVGEKTELTGIDLDKFIPKKLAYYHFTGSLTTPPCTEGVSWYVLKEVLEISKAQLEKFQKIMKHSNARPIQPTNNRIIIGE